jgi:hypothetical protein
MKRKSSYVLERIAPWPKQDIKELEEAAREIETRRTGVYRLDDDERASVRTGMKEASWVDGVACGFMSEPRRSGERRQMRSGLFLENESKRERKHKYIPCQRVNRSLPGMPQDRLSRGARCVMARATRM